MQQRLMIIINELVRPYETKTDTYRHPNRHFTDTRLTLFLSMSSPS